MNAHLTRTTMVTIFMKKLTRNISSEFDGFLKFIRWKIREEDEI